MLAAMTETSGNSLTYWVSAVMLFLYVISVTSERTVSFLLYGGHGLCPLMAESRPYCEVLPTDITGFLSVHSDNPIKKNKNAADIFSSLLRRLSFCVD